MADTDTSPAGSSQSINMPSAPAMPATPASGAHGMSAMGGIGMGILAAFAVGSGFYAITASGKSNQMLNNQQALLVNQAAQGAKVDYIMNQTNASAQSIVQIPALITNSALQVEQFGQNQGFRDFEKRWHRHDDYHGQEVRIASPNQFDNSGGYNAVRR